MMQLWSDMAKEGNWVPSWPDSLAELNAESASWTPGLNCHSIWQEVVHVTFWRRATLSLMAGGSSPSSEEVEQKEFALPASLDAESWAATVADFERAYTELAAAISDSAIDVSRVTYHLIHDAYHLGRITQLRAMQGTPPVF